METELLEQAKAVLAANDRGDWTVPADGLYPHQWLWDSCFIAIGLRYVDVARAQKELESLVRGQWANGMLPHIIFSKQNRSWERRHEEAWINPHAPNGVVTSGITQPPMLAEAVWLVGQKLESIERRSWYAHMLPHIVKYHQWLYNERCRDGLAFVIHPYESGRDSSPGLLAEMKRYAWPWWLKLGVKVKLDALARVFRRDTKSVPATQRISPADGIADWALMWRLHRRAYETQSILRRPKFLAVDAGFNAIFVRANERLEQIAASVGDKLPEDLQSSMDQTASALESLWSEAEGQYFSRSLISGELINMSSIAALLPLYTGKLTKERADQLVAMLKRRSQFKVNWPVPSVPHDSPSFDPIRYWQGPTWINTNWLIIDGLERSGFAEEASDLRRKTIELLGKSGCFEYFNPLTGDGLGAKDFSWTAALCIDLLKH